MPQPVDDAPGRKLNPADAVAFEATAAPGALRAVDAMDATAAPGVAGSVDAMGATVAPSGIAPTAPPRQAALESATPATSAGTRSPSAATPGLLGVALGTPSADAATPGLLGMEHTVAAERNTLGRYGELMMLGAGGMGVVYQATDPALKRRVAIKVMNNTSEEFRVRFAREAQAMARLSHPRIVHVYDYGEAEDTKNPYFVMEFIRGRSLAELLKEQGRLAVDEATRLLRQAAEGLAAAHRAGIIHRDIKPANLMVDEHGELKVVDFGIAHVSEGAPALTTPNAIMGTPHYMSPEMLAGKPVDARADIYALGLTMWHLLAGKAPFSDANPMLVAMMHLNAPLPSLRERAPEVPEALCALLERMAEKDRERRIQSCSEVIAVLDAMTSPSVAAAGATTKEIATKEIATKEIAINELVSDQPAPPPHPPTTRRLPVWGMGAAAVVAVAGIGLVMTYRSGGPAGGTPPPKPTAITMAGRPDAPTTGSGARGVAAVIQVPPHEQPRRFAAPLRLAIIDFRNLGGTPALAFLSGGIGESLLSELNQEKGVIRVIERTQLDKELGLIDFEQTKYVDPTLRAALGKIVGAQVAVLGAYQQAGGKIRITARIVAIETGDVLEAVTLTRPDKDLLSVQDEVAAELRRRVRTLIASTDRTP